MSCRHGISCRATNWCAWQHINIKFDVFRSIETHRVKRKEGWTLSNSRKMFAKDGSRSDRLVDLIVTLQRQLDEARRRIEELERKLGGSPTAKVAEPFSVRAEEQRQKRRPARSPNGAPKSGGAGSRRRRSSRRPCGRKRSFRAVCRRKTAGCRTRGRSGGWRTARRCWWPMKSIVARRINTARFPACFGRSEFGMEIVLAIAYQVYVVGLSFDKVCLLMNFFQNLQLRKSQAERAVESVGAAMGRGVRSAVHAAGQLAGGAYRRDGLEHPQRVGLSLRRRCGCCSSACIRTRRRCGRFSIRRRLRES